MLLIFYIVFLIVYSVLNWVIIQRIYTMKFPGDRIKRGITVYLAVVSIIVVLSVFFLIIVPK